MKNPLRMISHSSSRVCKPSINCGGSGGGGGGRQLLHFRFRFNGHLCCYLQLSDQSIFSLTLKTLS
ncbi:hypothetical protein TYRP_012939 [Tyrophagus putrescentiae]|nr:hypothetical protein TYRP_012939 [Tyrophagus putrescentiae]